MRKISIASIVLMIGFVLMAGFMSCEKETNDNDDNNNDNNNDNNDDNNNDNNDCFGTIDLTTHFKNPQTIDFINANEGWIVGQNSDNITMRTLIHTIDGGLTWEVMNTDLKVHSTNVISAPFIKFHNSTDGYMIGKYVSSIGGKELYYTTNKGETWTIIPNVNFDPGDWDVFAVNSTEAIFIGHNVGYYDEVMFRVSNTTHEILHEIDLPSSLDFYAKGDMHLAENGVINTPVSRVNTSSSLYMARTTDYGNVWTYLEIDLEAIYNVDFPTDNTGYVSGDIGLDGFIYKTIDAGVTWVKKSLPISFVNIHFFDAENGLGINQNHIYKTTDGAETWTEVSCFADSDHQPTRGVAFMSLTKWYAIGTRWVDSEDISYSEFYIYEPE